VSDGRGGETVGTITLKLLARNQMNISVPSFTTTGAHLTMAGTPNHNYLVQTSTNLVNWTDLGTVTADTLGNILYQDTAATNYFKRFYRAEAQ
jgi:hypothetical protein